MTDTATSRNEATCGCSCGCHNTTGHGGRYRGCRRKARWLPEYRVWACNECLVTCDE